MPCLPFDAMPDTARLWIFPATRPLSAAEGERVLAETDAFIAGWAAHGVPLTAARDLRHERFLSVTLDTIVFDNTITRVGDVRSGRWERPAADAWHGRAFFGT